MKKLSVGFKLLIDLTILHSFLRELNKLLKPIKLK